MGLVVRYDFVARLVSASHVKTPALVRDQLQVWLDHNSVEVLDTTVLLEQRRNRVNAGSKFSVTIAINVAREREKETVTSPSYF